MAYFELSLDKLFSICKNLENKVDILSFNYKVNPEVGKVLDKNTNIQFVVSSYLATKDIKNKSRINYIVQAESQKELNSLYSKGIRNYIVDNENDLEKVIKLRDINLFLRMKFKEHTMYTGKYFVYGFSFENINKLITKLKDNKNIRTLNLHFHRRTQNIGEWNLTDEFSDAIEEKNLKYISIVNIGGGLPSKYINSKPDTKVIFDKISKFKSYLNSNNIKLMIEPGRYISAPSVRLITEVKNIYDSNVIVDCSIFNAYMDTYLMHMRLKILCEVQEGGYTYLIKGISPDSLDIFRYKVSLPKKLKTRDKLVFENAGAYNFHTEFAELPKLKTKIVNKW